MVSSGQFVSVIKKKKSHRAKEKPKKRSRLLQILTGTTSAKRVLVKFPSKLTNGVATKMLPYQSKVREFYLSTVIQMLVAFLILTNFIASAINAQLLPENGSVPYVIIQGFEYAFTTLFTIELLVNFYGHFFWEFWRNSWNWFDFFVVAISLISLGPTGMPGINVLRLFRAFRVIRLFKRIDSLRNIIDGCIASVPDVANAFLVLFLIMGIWSIMGVTFYSTKLNPSLKSIFGHDPDDDSSPPYMNFDTFVDAMFTMWALLTLEGWVGVTMPLVYDVDIASLLFFVSFYFIASIILMNVVIAILLENYLEATQAQARARKNEDPSYRLQELEDRHENCELYIQRLENILRLAESTSAEDVWPNNPSVKLKFEWQLVQKRCEVVELDKQIQTLLYEIVDDEPKISGH